MKNSPAANDNPGTAVSLSADKGSAPDEEGTGLPALRTWTALYVFVAVVFAAWVALLYALTRAFS